MKYVTIRDFVSLIRCGDNAYKLSEELKPYQCVAQTELKIISP